MANQLAQQRILKGQAAGENEPRPVAVRTNPRGARRIVVGHPCESGVEEMTHSQVLLARMGDSATVAHRAEVEGWVHLQVGGPDVRGFGEDVIPRIAQLQALS